MELNIDKKQIITGKLVVEDESVKIGNIDVLFRGDVFDKVEPDGNQFVIEIDERFENGNYEIHWHVEINGKEHIVKGNFVVSNDKINPSLPLDLQHLMV